MTTDQYDRHDSLLACGEAADGGVQRGSDPLAGRPDAGRLPIADAGAAALARRDRIRLTAALDEAAALRARLHDLEASLSGRMLAPARKLLRSMSPLVIAGQELLRGPPPAPPASPWVRRTGGRGCALVVDHSWPQPDRDSGSMDIVTLVESLDRLGFDVILAAHLEHDTESPARAALEARGIRCLTAADAVSVEWLIQQAGWRIDLCVLCRVLCGGEFFEAVQQHQPGARVVFDTIDLHWVREERRARLSEDPKLLQAVAELKAREEHLIRNSDTAVVVSDAEAALLARTMPDALVVQLPLARPVQRPAASWQQRRGLGFIGGFTHAPNVDAVRHFLADIWPLVLERLPDCTLSLVGDRLPDGLLDGVAGQVEYLGHVPDIGPWFESLRLTVAPLRFGAGAKGKVASSLAAGVPCVATPVAAEGMGLDGASGVLVGATPAAFADAVQRAYTDPGLWQSLSSGGLDYAGRVLSPDAWQARLDGMLRRIGL